MAHTQFSCPKRWSPRVAVCRPLANRKCILVISIFPTLKYDTTPLLAARERAIDVVASGSRRIRRARFVRDVGLLAAAGTG